MGSRLGTGARDEARRGSHRTHASDAGSLCGPDRDLPELPRFSLQLRIHRPGVIKSVTWDGEELTESETHGFVITEDPASHIVRINVDRMLTKGDHHAAVHYDIEW